MDYEQKYREALEHAKTLYENANGMILKKWVEQVFPELKESDDERIRKKLISFFTERAKHTEDSTFNGLSSKEIIAWLEKQGEQNLIMAKSPQLGERKPVDNGESNLLTVERAKEISPFMRSGFENESNDKVEPKFREGDMIIHKELGGDYIHSPHKIIQVDILDKKYRLEGGLVAHFGEQDDYELVEQKPIWSEEDKTILDNLIYALANDRIGNNRDEYVDWLKSLKDRVLPKQEWSEEDEAGLADAIWAINQARTIAKDENDMGNLWYAEHWLKSIKDRYTWKPSDEQMNALNYVVNLMASSERPTENDLYYNILKSLRQQLMKLKGIKL